jgi:hypothetical protein
VTTASGRPLAVYTFDDTLAHDVAFGGLLRDGRGWAARLRAAARAAPDALVAVASGAEAFGHHHRFGDMALAAMFDALERPPAPADGADGAGVRVETFAAHFARHADAEGPAVALAGPSSWGCPHGLERWRADCGCRRDPSTHQRWRAPLRAALQGVREALAERFAREGGDLFAGAAGGADAVRDAYNDALPAARGPGDVLATAGGAVPPTRDPVWARELLEMEREALAMFDSDAWFGDDVDEGPARLALAHAARAVSLAGPLAPALERRLLEALGRAPSNDPAAGSARVVYTRHARPTVPTALRVAAGVAAARAVGDPGALPAAWAADFDGDGDLEDDPPDDDTPGTVTPARRTVALAARAPGVPGGADGAATVHVTVADRRLGRSATYAVTVDIPTPVAVGAPGAPAGARAGRLADVDPRAITVLARPVGGNDPAAGPDALAAALKLADLPGRARERVERALRRAVVRRLLDEREREQLAAGAASLDVLAGAALVRAVAALERDTSAPAVARVLGLADLADAAAGSGGALPGAPLGAALADAQSALYALAARLAPEARAALAPVAYRWASPPAGGARWGTRRRTDADPDALARRTRRSRRARPFRGALHWPRPWARVVRTERRPRAAARHPTPSLPHADRRLRRPVPLAVRRPHGHGHGVASRGAAGRGVAGPAGARPARGARGHRPALAGGRRDGPRPAGRRRRGHQRPARPARPPVRGLRAAPAAPRPAPRAARRARAAERGGAELPRQGAHEGRAARRRRARRPPRPRRDGARGARVRGARGLPGGGEAARRRRLGGHLPRRRRERAGRRAPRGPAPPRRPGAAGGVRRRRRALARDGERGRAGRVALAHALLPHAAGGRAEPVGAVVRGAPARGRRRALRRHPPGGRAGRSGRSA